MIGLRDPNKNQEQLLPKSFNTLWHHSLQSPGDGGIKTFTRKPFQKHFKSFWIEA